MAETKYRVHEVAKRLNLSPSGVRKKENLGEFPPPRRDEQNWRYYTEEDVLKLKAYFVSKERRTRKKA